MSPRFYVPKILLSTFQKSWKNSRKEKIISKMIVIMGRDFPTPKKILPKFQKK